MSPTPTLVLLGGLAVFLHGLEQAKSGLSLAAGDRLRKLIGAITRNRFVGAAAGFVFTVVIQSSTAVTLMVVDYAGAGMCTFADALAVLLGAGLGSTVIVQLVSFRLAHYALALVALGALSRAWVPKSPWPRALVGLGLLFFGLELMSRGATPLLRGEDGAAALRWLDDHPVLSLLAAALSTVVLQGSAPVIGLVLSVVAQGHMTLTQALPFVLGANVGTTLTPLAHALRKPPAGRLAAVANVAVKSAGALLLLPFAAFAAPLIAATTTDPARQVANAHTLFNALLLVVGLIALGPISRSVARLYTPDDDDDGFRIRHLRPEVLGTPALALGQAMRELMNLGTLVGEMLQNSFVPVCRGDLDVCDQLEQVDDRVDLLNREIRFYLARVSVDALTPAQAERRMDFINVCSELEGIGDVVTRTLVPLARKRASKGTAFSPEGEAELGRFHTAVVQAYETALAAFAAGDEELARRASRQLEALGREEPGLIRSHVERLGKGELETHQSSSLHLDVLEALSSIAARLHALVVATERRRPRAVTSG